MNENQDAAERMQLTERAADRLIELYRNTTGFDASDLHEGAR
jgi:deoxyhypusine synthase